MDGGGRATIRYRGLGGVEHLAARELVGERDGAGYTIYSWVGDFSDTARRFVSIDSGCDAHWRISGWNQARGRAPFGLGIQVRFLHCSCVSRRGGRESKGNVMHFDQHADHSLRQDLMLRWRSLYRTLGDHDCRCISSSSSFEGEGGMMLTMQSRNVFKFHVGFLKPNRCSDVRTHPYLVRETSLTEKRCIRSAGRQLGR